MTVFFDTNLLAYQFDDAEPTRQARARQVFLESASEAVVSTQVLLELHAVLTRKLGRSRAQARQVLDALELDVVPADASLVRRAARTADEHALSIFDAMVLEAAVLAGCSELWTEDLSHGSSLRGVRVVNPFRADGQ
ncbi:PIN domain-containing protein [Flexivirga oryzae]|uniref:Ribonuclease VapC n=1 Tax=Flexivirga oryzae TaxID=1794944 RepID=A0A839MZ73_9MICO|nr:putative nucleic acid-binding protein [Flexivirga oryzae]